VENVPGLATAGLGLVIGDLAEAGYDCEWLRVRASDVGAPHRRERLFIVAALADTDDGRCAQHDAGKWRVSVTSPDSTQPVNWGAYEPAIRRWENVMGTAPAPTDEKNRLAPAFVEWMMGAPDGWTEGVSRTQRLKMLGNGVQVQVGTLLGEALADLSRKVA
jgi:DNA (cytosine-5)-methyltransferase 1